MAIACRSGRIKAHRSAAGPSRWQRFPRVIRRQKRAILSPMRSFRSAETNLTRTKFLRSHGCQSSRLVDACCSACETIGRPSADAQILNRLFPFARTRRWQFSAGWRPKKIFREEIFFGKLGSEGPGQTGFTPTSSAGRWEDRRLIESFWRRAGRRDRRCALPLSGWVKLSLELSACHREDVHPIHAATVST